MSESETEKKTQARSSYKEGFQLFVKGQIEDAIAHYRKALAMDATLSIAWNGLSMALAKQGDFSAAIDAAEKLVELEPDDPLSHTNLSRILMQKGLIPEAEAASARAMGLQMRQQNQ